MKTISILLIAMVFVVALTACQNQNALPPKGTTTVENQDSVLEPQTETDKYIDSQFVDPQQDVQIGEMI
jgi:curli biogenesis system outer membrane secretion channel CsgG